MFRRDRQYRTFGLVGVGLSALLAGCTGFGSLFNNEFLTEVGLGDQVSVLPGEAPAIIIEMENQTGRVVEYRLSWRAGDEDDLEFVERTGTLAVGDKVAEAVICPVQEITVGDVSNLDAFGAVVRLGQGTADDAFIEVEPFGVLLQNRVNYNCGDIVTFAVRPSGATASGYQLFAYVRRSGATIPLTTSP